MKIQNLPTGQQDFGRLREDDLLYVDKTMYIHRLLSEKKAFVFLSRPRRFGKSLFLNTLKEVFLGNKRLFEGLYIEDKIDWEVFPVIHFDFSRMSVTELGLTESIGQELKTIAGSYGVPLQKTGIGQQFAELIQKLREKTGKQVAILIDEYDKPITEYLESYKKAGEQRDILRNFYGILKGNSAHIRMVFITGISRFARISLFSDMNNFSDISFDKNYAGICGYTKEELESRFAGHLQAAADDNEMGLETFMEEVRLWYNGYSWDGIQRVYNPFSILRFLDTKTFGNYWFESGTPKFLIKMLKPGFRFDLRKETVDFATFDNYDMDNLNIETLLFQTGYLTVKEIDKFRAYILGYPNKEVEQSMLRYMLMDYSANAVSPSIAGKLIVAVEDGDMDRFSAEINTLFAGIPGPIFLEHREAYFHSILFIALKLCGFHIAAEVSTAKGRVDAVMHCGGIIYVFEFKLDRSANEALKQIKEKGYAEPYMGKGQEVRLVGINFSSKTKRVGACKVELAQAAAPR